jgi:hypothetical protein
MAVGWQDSLIQFTPYIEQVPVEDYARVGVMKQQQYDAGVNAVQGMVDNIANMPVAREVDKQYLNQKLGQLGTELNKSAGADFSRGEIVKTLGGLTKQVSSDPILRNAVGSATRYQGELAKLTKAQSEGKSSPANDYVFQNRASKWLNSQDINESFNGSYQEFFDIDKVAREAINEVRKTPGETIRQNPFKWDATKGEWALNEAMIQEEAKGIDPGKIRDAIATVLNDPRAMNQLSINGEFEYRNDDKQTMFLRTKTNYQNALSDNQLKIDKLNTIAHNGSKVERDTAQKELEAIKGDTSKMLVEYNQDVDLLDQNPDAYKTAFYMRNFQQRYANAYSYLNETTKVLTNPLYSAYADRLKYNLDVDKFDYTQKKDAADRELELIKIANTASKAEGKGKKAGAEDSIFSSSVPRPFETGTIAKGSSVINSTIATKQATFGLKTSEFINSLFDETNKPYIINNGNVAYRTKENGYSDSPYATQADAKKHAAEQFTVTKMAADKGEETAPRVREFFDNNDDDINDLNDLRETRDKIEKKYEPTVGAFNRKAANAGIPESVDIQTSTAGFAGSVIKATREDLVELALYDDSKIDKTLLKERMDAKMGKQKADALISELRSGAFSASYEGDSKLKGYLNQIKKLGPDAALAGVFEAREADYTKIQRGFQDFGSTFKANKAEERTYANQLFKSHLSNKTLNNAGLEGGVDADDVKTLLDEDEKKKNLVYGYYRDRNSGASYLTLSTGLGKDEMRIKLTDQEASMLPEVQLSDPFYDTYGKRFHGRDITGTTKETAMKPLNGGKYEDYTVKVHLRDVNGAYEINMFVYDKKQSKWVVEGKPMNIAGRNLLSQDEVTTVLSNMNNLDVDRYVKSLNK